MSSVWNSKLKDIRDDTASNKPTVTSGSVSVICAVYACSLVQMSLKISSQKISAKIRLKKITSIIQHVEHASAELSELADRDIGVFQNFLAAFALPVKTNEQKKLRETMIAIRRLETIRIPLKGAEEIIHLFPLIVESVPFCQHNLLSDLAVAANMLNNAVSNLLWNVKDNAAKLEEVQKLNLLRSAKHLASISASYAKQINRQVVTLIAK
jgi:formiminotetrahydrofolate cyclodeaminase